MFQIAYINLQALSIDEFYILFHLSMQRQICYESCSLADFEKKLRAKTGGLIEVVDETQKKVKLIHETVRAYCDRLCGDTESSVAEHGTSWAVDKLLRSSSLTENGAGSCLWFTSKAGVAGHSVSRTAIPSSAQDNNQHTQFSTSERPYSTVLNVPRTSKDARIEERLGDSSTPASDVSRCPNFFSPPLGDRLSRASWIAHTRHSSIPSKIDRRTMTTQQSRVKLLTATRAPTIKRAFGICNMCTMRRYKVGGTHQTYIPAKLIFF